MTTDTKDFRAKKKAELKRWRRWWEKLDQLASRPLVFIDQLDGMEPGSRLEDPERYSIEGAAEIVDGLLSLIEEMATHGYPDEHAAEMLRDAADRIE